MDEVLYLEPTVGDHAKASLGGAVVGGIIGVFDKAIYESSVEIVTAGHDPSGSILAGGLFTIMAGIAASAFGAVADNIPTALTGFAVGGVLAFNVASFGDSNEHIQAMREESAPQIVMLESSSISNFQSLVI